jgi:hypothetical protein
MARILSKSISQNYIYNPSVNYYLDYIIFFFIWPFGSFIYSLFNFEKKEAKIILILFTGIFGYSMIAESQLLDLYKIKNSLPGFVDYNIEEFLDHIKNLYNNPESDSADPYRDLITFFVSRFTTNGKWLMLVFGLITGYAYTKVLSLFVFPDDFKTINKFLIIIPFSFIIGLDQLAGVRFCLAAYVFFFGTIKYLTNSEKKYLLIATISIFIHFSFLPVVLLLLFFIWLKRFPKAIFLLTLLSFFLPDSFKEYFNLYSGIFGESIETRTLNYYNLESQLDLSSGSWFVDYRITLMLFFCYAMLLITKYSSKKIIITGESDRLFYFSLLVLSYVNFTSNIPHLGYRFQFIFMMFAVFYLYKVFIQTPKSLLLYNLLLLQVFSSLLLILYSVRGILSYMPLSVFYFNLPTLLMDQSLHGAWRL